MGFAWSENVNVGASIDAADITEIRTNVDTVEDEKCAADNSGYFSDEHGTYLSGDNGSYDGSNRPGYQNDYNSDYDSGAQAGVEDPYYG